MPRRLLAVLVLLFLPEIAVADLRSGLEAYRRQDFATAFHELLPEAKGGNSVAAGIVAGLYRDGLGVAADKPEGCLWAQRAADQDSPPGEYYHGLCLEEGAGAPPDKAQAALWFRKAAGQGYAPAQLALGRRLLEGDGVPHDPVGGTEWLKLAAEQGEAQSMNALGKCYELGTGRPRDQRLAYAWYKDALESETDALRRTADRIDFERIAARMSAKERQFGDLETQQQQTIRQAATRHNAEQTGGASAAAGPGAGVSAFGPLPAATKPGGSHAAGVKSAGGQGNNVQASGAGAGRTADGDVGGATTAGLEAATGAGTPSSAPPAGSDPQSEVAVLIASLDELGFDAGPPRDQLNSRAESAVKAFQRRFGGPELGRLTRRMWEALVWTLDRRRVNAMIRPDPKHRPAAIGVGFVVSVFGQVLTTDRVVTGCRETRTADKRSLSVVATDESRHLALLKLPTATPDAATLRGGGDPGLGDRVAVLGFPLSGRLASDAIMISGRVASLDAAGHDGGFIELSIPLASTDAGSPVLDGSGRIVGMATEAITAGKADAQRPASGETAPDDHSLAVTGAAMRAFLEANHVVYRTASPKGAPAVFDAANRPRAYMLRVECFK